MTDPMPTPVERIEPLQPVEARPLAECEYRRLDDLLTRLREPDFARPTDCSEWDVRALLAHLLGTAQANASMRENLHQLRAARRWAAEHGRSVTDGLTTVQVTERAGRSGAELVDGFRRAWPAALRGRFRVPRPVRALVRIPADTPAGAERWRLGYLLEVIYTRDAWMHRIDLSRAVGHDPVLSPEHDGRLVVDLVGEWARRHGQPFVLDLGGPAGGRFVAGTGGPHLELDAIEFARTISGRAAGAGLLGVQVPF